MIVPLKPEEVSPVIYSDRSNSYSSERSVIYVRIIQFDPVSMLIPDIKKKGKKNLRDGVAV